MQMYFKMLSAKKFAILFRPQYANNQNIWYDDQPTKNETNEIIQ